MKTQIRKAARSQAKALQDSGRKIATVDEILYTETETWFITIAKTIAATREHLDSFEKQLALEALQSGIKLEPLAHSLHRGKTTVYGWQHTKPINGKQHQPPAE